MIAFLLDRSALGDQAQVATPEGQSVPPPRPGAERSLFLPWRLGLLLAVAGEAPRMHDAWETTDEAAAHLAGYQDALTHLANQHLLQPWMPWAQDWAGMAGDTA